MKDRFIAIGDIHACNRPLREILAQCKEYPEHRIIFLGDYIDRGPDPGNVLHNIKRTDAVFLMGNHEAMMFDLVDICDNREKALRFLGRRGLGYENYLWLRENCIPFYETEEYIFSHAGLNPGRSLEEQELADYLWTFHREEYHNTEKIVVHGHNSEEEIRIVGNNINVDTGCGKGGYLSALVLPERIELRSKSRGRTLRRF